MEKDYSNKSLDEYIHDNPALFSLTKKPVSSAPRFRKPSQQWRLGRNGPRPMKRLSRPGPLRPFNYRTQNPRRDDGLPRLVRKHYSSLRPNSVFHRLGWNPLCTIARNRLQMAKDRLAMRRYNYHPKYNVVSTPMGPRPMRYFHQRYVPNNRYNGRHQYQGNQRPMPITRNPNFQGEQLVKMQRLHMQRKRLRKMQNSNWQKNLYNRRLIPNRNPQNYIQTQQNYEQNHQPDEHNRIPNLVQARAPLMEGPYRIPSDDFIPLDRDIRPPSPTGSIISAISQSYSKMREAGSFTLPQQSLQPGQTPFQQGQTPFQQGQNPFQQGQNPFQQGRNPFQQGQNPFQQGQNSFQQGPKSFQPGNPFRNTSFIQPQASRMEPQTSSFRYNLPNVNNVDPYRMPPATTGISLHQRFGDPPRV